MDMSTPTTGEKRLRKDSKAEGFSDSINCDSCDSQAETIPDKSSECEANSVEDSIKEGSSAARSLSTDKHLEEIQSTDQLFPGKHPAWFYGSEEWYPVLKWFMEHRNEHSIEPISRLLTNNYYFHDINRTAGELKVVIEVKPMAHQQKGLNGSRVFLTAAARGYRESIQSQIKKCFLPAWDFEERRTSIIPKDSLIRIETMQFAYGYLRKHEGLDSRLELKLIPKKTKPDLDNLTKSFFDAAEKLLFSDDKEIVELNEVCKVYSDKPGITLHLSWTKDCLN